MQSADACGVSPNVGRISYFFAQRRSDLDLVGSRSLTGAIESMAPALSSSCFLGEVNELDLIHFRSVLDSTRLEANYAATVANLDVWGVG